MSDRAWRRRAAALIASVALTACVPTLPQGPARAPNTRVPESFGGAADTTNSASADWRTFFGDPHLAELIDVALGNNQELNIAVQEMLVANNEVMARRGEYLPSMGVALGAGVDRVGRFTSQGQSDEATGVGAILQNYSLGVYASWEVDVWSRLRNATRAATFRYLASGEGRKFMVTRLVGEIATRYYELRALDRQLAIVRDNIRLQQDALEMVRIQQQAARVTMLAVRRFEAQLQGFQARQFEIAQRIVEAENALHLLLGRFPRPIVRSDADILTTEPAAVHTGLPAQLLENRPDVRRAELELRAAALDVASARAAFYPALRLDGRLGYQAFDVRRLFDTPDSILFNLFAGITAPLLNRAGLTAAYFSANSVQMQAVLRYERAILNAFLEVNTGVSLLGNLARMYELKSQQVDRLRESVDISTLLFNSARADYLEVLTTRRDSLEAQMELIEIRQRQLAATVTVYQALGGGWRTPTTTPAAPAAPAGGAR
ncbi:MAG: efflux transporter outer membrane subunit [Polyangiales bacterium]